MFYVIKVVSLNFFIATVLFGCNQPYIKGTFPTFKAPEWRKHEVDPIVKKATLPKKRFKYDRIEISRTEKNEPLVNGRILRSDVARVERATNVSDTGYVTYVVGSPDTKATYAVKYYKPLKKTGKSTESMADTFGYIFMGNALTGEKNRFKHGSIFGGKSYIFDEYVLGSFGILLIRDKTTLIYFDADNEQPYVSYLPEKANFNYKLSGIQSGDISYTRHVLVNRYVDNLRMLSIKVDDEYLYDYSWFNLEKDQITTTFPMYVDGRTGKSVDNWVFNYDNPKIKLIGTEHGPISFSREGEYYKSIVARNLWTGEKAMLFYRWHGVGGLSGIRMTTNGSLSIETAYGFDTRKLDDVLKYIKENNGIDLSKVESKRE